MSRLLLAAFVCLLTGPPAWTADDLASLTTPELQEHADSLYDERNYAEALRAYEELVARPDFADLVSDDLESAGRIVRHVWWALEELGRGSELDVFRERLATRHADNWRVLAALVVSYTGDDDRFNGEIVGGRFVAEYEWYGPTGGIPANQAERHRVLALRLLRETLPLLPEPSGDAGTEGSVDDRVGNALLGMARAVRYRVGEGDQFWRLPYLTDLETLPDYELGHWDSWNADIGPAPTDANGDPIFYEVPPTFETAQSDGERYRWCSASVEPMVLAPASLFIAPHAAGVNPALRARQNRVGRALLPVLGGGAWASNPWFSRSSSRGVERRSTEAIPLVRDSPKRSAL